MPPIVAHAVNTSGECRRSTLAPNAVYVAQHRAAAIVNANPIGEPVSSIPTPAAMTSTTPANERTTPTPLSGLSVSVPMSTAMTAVSTGLAAINSAESPAGIDCRPTVHSIW